VWRILAALGVPCVLLLMLELGLRLFGFGYPPGFFLPGVVQGEEMLLNNPKYGWRFFPVSLARAPWPFAARARKPEGVVRVFIFGESAAMGDPDPRFSMARMLEAMLAQRYPGRKFEVVNTAFTAINSHVILPIAEECSQQSSDLWVIYMGNNEVVGPFGSGTVFGMQSPPLSLVRGSVALKATRLGQALAALSARVGAGADGPQEWGGMEMFEQQEVGRDDARMARVYSSFESNLTGILGCGREAGVPVVLCTVASNLRDCAPFASLWSGELSAEERARGEELLQTTMQVIAAGDDAVAVPLLEALLVLDEGHAGVHFQLAQCLERLGKQSEAMRHFRLARDLDALRFRADSGLNGVVMRLARERAGEDLRLVDCEEVLGERSEGGVPGREFFYEHVHLTPEGNYQVAVAIAEQVAGLLAGRLEGGLDSGEWASAEACFEWLGLTDASRYTMQEVMVKRMTGIPFNRQAGHEEDLAYWRDSMTRLESFTRPARLRSVVSALQAGVNGRPDDLDLRFLLAENLALVGDLQGAEREFRYLLERLPNAQDQWSNLGAVLESQGRSGEAVECFRRCLALSPWQAQARARVQTLTSKP
jgi:tetratricopeptide (TPR) repeat protein